MNFKTFSLIIGLVIIYLLLPESLSTGFAYLATLWLTLRVYTQPKKRSVKTTISGDFIIHYNTVFFATDSPQIVKNGRLIPSEKNEKRMLLYMNNAFYCSILKTAICKITDMEGNPLRY